MVFNAALYAGQLILYLFLFLPSFSKVSSFFPVRISLKALEVVDTRVVIIRGFYNATLLLFVRRVPILAAALSCYPTRADTFRSHVLAEIPHPHQCNESSPVPREGCHRFLPPLRMPLFRRAGSWR